MRRQDLLSTIVYVPHKAYNGYTLFSPKGAEKTWLIDMQGRFVHCWQAPYKPGEHAVLLPNGRLLYAGRLEDGPLTGVFGGVGGVLLELDWNGDEVWRYEDPFMHHDFCRMDNGNTMVLRWEEIPKDVAAKVKGGVPGTERDGVIWGDAFQEIDRDGNMVWEWHGYDHLDPEEYVICPLCRRADWTHCNNCEILPDGNILTTSFTMNSILIIEKKTGAIKWRWGQEELGHPHNPTLLDNGNILVFDNGLHRPMVNQTYSRILEVEQETGKIVWEYMDATPTYFSAPFISGSQRLPNGNTFICTGPTGHFFEVTKGGEIVWEYINPFFYQIPMEKIGFSNLVFRAHRYAPDYPGLKGQELDTKKFEWLNGVYGPDGLGKGS
jgi:outer membrane protein assembly factor BamB